MASDDAAASSRTADRPSQATTPAADRLGLRGRIGLALGSGAARGWAHIGVIRALAEQGIEPDVISGTSVGAIVGAAFAAGRLDAFEAWARGIEWRRLASALDLSLRGGLVNPRRLLEFFERDLPGGAIESLGRPFGAVGTDLANGQEVWMRQGDLLEALHASVALPGLITPSRWRGRWMVDGGLVNPVPISLCRALGADSVIAVDLNTTLLGRRRFADAPASPRSTAPHDAPPAASGGGVAAVAGAASAPDEAAESAAGEGEALPGPRSLRTRVNALVQELADDLRERIGIGADEGPTMPSLYEVMANSVNIMQVRIGRSRMAGDPPELLITPRMSDFAIVDFDRADEAIAEGRRAVGRALSG